MPVRGVNSPVEIDQGRADGEVRLAWGEDVGRGFSGGFLWVVNPLKAASGMHTVALHAPHGHSPRSASLTPKRLLRVICPLSWYPGLNSPSSWIYWQWCQSAGTAVTNDHQLGG